MKSEHEPGCFCDACIKARVIAEREKREQNVLANDYIKRRGGLDRPPNRKGSSPNSNEVKP